MKFVRQNYLFYFKDPIDDFGKFANLKVEKDA